MRNLDQQSLKPTFGGYLHALWRQWLRLVMGGSVSGLVAIYGYTGFGFGANPDASREIARYVGLALLGVTFFHATYRVWKEQRVAWKELYDELERIKNASLRLKITRVIATDSGPVA